MFLDKPEDITYFNRIMRDSPHLEPYFAELAVWAWIYQREKYLEIINLKLSSNIVKYIDERLRGAKYTVSMTGKSESSDGFYYIVVSIIQQI